MKWRGVSKRGENNGNEMAAAAWRNGAINVKLSYSEENGGGGGSIIGEIRRRIAKYQRINHR
jgi:hypothetical protein